MRFVFLMDPIERINIDADSTFVLMLESQNRGHEVLYAHPRALTQRGNATWVTAQPAQVRRTPGDHFSLGAPTQVALDDTDAVFMRRDPPFDVDYLVATYLLDRVDRSRVVMINEPQALRDCNEKLTALWWPHLMPRSLVSADRRIIRDLVDELGQVVVKPLMNAGGLGVLRLERGHPNIGSIIDLLTDEGRRPLLAQAYIAEVSQGDKRIILLDGEPIGVVNRIPQGGEVRANMHVGGKAVKSSLDDRDRAICAEIGPELSRRGLVFTGIDVIGGLLTEVNVTSPTGLQEIDRFDGVCLEGMIIDWVERRRRALG